MTEQCTEELAPGLRCQRPSGHDGEHMVEGEVPDDIARMLASMMEHAEQAERRARKAYRTYRIMSAVLLVTLVYIVAISIIT